jgi:hypothetical protein
MSDNNNSNQSNSASSWTSHFDLKTILTIAIPAVAILLVGLVFTEIDVTLLTALLIFTAIILWIIWKPLATLTVKIPKFKIIRSIPPSISLKVRWPFQVILTILVIIVSYLIFQKLWLDAKAANQPNFEITALNTLPGDMNIYEVTDQLIWNAYGLDEYGVVISYTIQVRPIYKGEDQYGEIVANISGDAGQLAKPKRIWSSFDNQADVVTFDLTLPEILEVTGLQTNSEFPENVSGIEPLIQEEVIQIEIAEKANMDNPLGAGQITFRNSPWDFRATLSNRVNENNEVERQIDFFIKNYGGEGDFTIRYRLVRLNGELSSEPNPMVNSVHDIGNWNEPIDFIHLKRDESYQGTQSLPKQITSNLSKGRYLLEVYAVKKQPYVQFHDPSTDWSDLNTLNSPWWFGKYPYYTPIFLETEGIDLDPLIKAELDRLQDENGVDLGIALGQPEEVTSKWGTVAQTQWFEYGIVYFYDDQVFAIYGPVYEYYLSKGLDRIPKIPETKLKTIQIDSDVYIYSMEFDKVCENCDVSEILVSPLGPAWLEGWIRHIYYQDYGGYNGWLGFPVGDIKIFPDSEIQLFRNGYISYFYPVIDVDEDGDDIRNWGNTPTAYRYLTTHKESEGTLFEVDAKKDWQDTGIYVNPDDNITIVHVGGSWENSNEGQNPFDANGNRNSPPTDYRKHDHAYGGSLIGKIGEEGSPFLVGRWSEFNAEDEGNLFLSMNDNILNDNDGIITVQIIHTKPEE